MSKSRNIYKKRGEDPLKLGDKINKWTVIKRDVFQGPGKHTKFLCRCVCGAQSSIDYIHLLKGNSKGCIGCSGRQDQEHCRRGHLIKLHGTTPKGHCDLCRFERYIERAYGITAEDYESMFGYQLGKCAICGIPLDLNKAFPCAPQKGGRRAEIDHRHVPKKVKPQPEKRTLVRGLLCGGRYAGCNARLGRVDNIEWLRSAAKYLEDLPAQKIFKIRDEAKERQK